MPDIFLPLVIAFVAFLASLAWHAGADAWQSIKAEWRRWRMGL